MVGGWAVLCQASYLVELPVACLMLQACLHEKKCNELTDGGGPGWTSLTPVAWML